MKTSVIQLQQEQAWLARRRALINLAADKLMLVNHICDGRDLIPVLTTQPVRSNRDALILWLERTLAPDVDRIGDELVRQLSRLLKDRYDDFMEVV